MKKILICGDSFSYDFEHPQSWPTKLKTYYEVINLSQCGCGEYKIRMQLLSTTLSQFDKILIFHTSPNRVYLRDPYILGDSDVHRESDLIFSDVENKKNKSTLAKIAYDYFIHIFDEDYSCYVHNLILSDIDQLTKKFSTKHFTNFDYTGMYDFDKTITSFYEIFLKHRGYVNHYDWPGHDILLKSIIYQIEK